MKRTLSILISLILSLSAMTAAAFADFADFKGDSDFGGESFERWNEALDRVPDDPFSGERVEVDNPDGSKTYMFSNGSIATEYPDGRQEGVDFDGNQHYKDTKGNITTKLPDGTSITDHADGRVSFAETDGKTTYVNPDKSSYETFKRTGIVKEYDAEGHFTGIGFMGSDERIAADGNGDLADGSIKGPDGRALKIENRDGGREINLTYADGHTLNYQGAGVEDSEDGRLEVYTIEGSSEMNGIWSTTTKIDRENGVAVGKTVERSGSFTDANGAKVEYDENIKYDNNGDPVYSANNVAQVTSSDGSKLWVDKNSQAWEYEAPNFGEKIVVDKDGNLKELNMDGETFKAKYDSSGKVKIAEWKRANGAELDVLPDGSVKVVLPNGTVYEEDSAGNIKKNGEFIRKDGEWVEGYDPKTDTGEKTQTDDTDEPDDTAEPDTDKLKDDELFRSLAGTYSGTYAFGYRMNDGTGSGMDVLEGTAWSIGYDGNNLIDETGGHVEISFDPSSMTGISYANSDEGTMTTTYLFTVTGTTVQLSFSSTLPDEQGEYVWEYNGTKGGIIA